MFGLSLNFVSVVLLRRFHCVGADLTGLQMVPQR